MISGYVDFFKRLLHAKEEGNLESLMVLELLINLL